MNILPILQSKTATETFEIFSRLISVDRKMGWSSIWYKYWNERWWVQFLKVGACRGHGKRNGDEGNVNCDGTPCTDLGTNIAFRIFPAASLCCSKKPDSNNKSCLFWHLYRSNHWRRRVVVNSGDGWITRRLGIAGRAVMRYLIKATTLRSFLTRLPPTSLVLVNFASSLCNLNKVSIFCSQLLTPVTVYDFATTIVHNDVFKSSSSFQIPFPVIPFSLSILNSFQGIIGVLLFYFDLWIRSFFRFFFSRIYCQGLTSRPIVDAI